MVDGPFEGMVDGGPEWADQPWAATTITKAAPPPPTAGRPIQAHHQPFLQTIHQPGSMVDGLGYG